MLAPIPGRARVPSCPPRAHPVAGPRRHNGAARVQGRIEAISGSELIVADALGRTLVTLTEPAGLRPGELVIVEGELAAGRVLRGRLVARYSAPEPHGSSEFARLAWQGVGVNLCQRAEALTKIREYFRAAHFVEVDTPLRVRAPQLDAGIRSIRAGDGWLIASPEYHMKRLLAGGMPRLFQLAHCWRAEELGPWHETEFMMLEWYRAFSELESVLVDTEVVVCEVVELLAGSNVIRAPGAGIAVEVATPFERLSVSDAFRRYAGVRDLADLARTDENLYFELMVSRVEPALASISRPVFLCDYPITQAALARPKEEDPEFAERAELYLGGIELCNAYGELTDAAENTRRLLAQSQNLRDEESGSPAPVDHSFLAALAEGLPPAAGNALGIDRLIALGLGAPDIARVQAFPAQRL